MPGPQPSRDERRRARIQEQRGARRRTATRRKPVVPLVAVAVVAVVGVGAVALLGGVGGGDEKAAERKLARLTRAGSTEVAGAPPVTIDRTPSAYRIVYRVEDRGERVEYRTDVVTVRRPWDSRLESLRGRPPGDEPLSTEAATFAQRTTTSRGQQPVVLDLPPAVPASDVRLAPALEPGLAAGVLARREVRTVAGRPCQVYRSHDYLSASVLRAPARESYVDSCVDAAGLVLEEALVERDVLIARRIAVEVDEHPDDVTDALFPRGTRTVQPSAGGGFVRRLKDGSMPPGDFHVLDAPPAGFVLRGRYSVIPPQAENFDASSPEREDFRRAEVADVYERGLDVLVVTQGGTLRGAPPFEADDDAGMPTIDLGRFGTGTVRVSALGNQVRAALDGGHYLVVSGTLAPEELAAVARGLRTIPGGGTLEYADDDGS